MHSECLDAHKHPDFRTYAGPMENHTLPLSCIRCTVSNHEVQPSSSNKQQCAQLETMMLGRDAQGSKELSVSSVKGGRGLRTGMWVVILICQFCSDGDGQLK